MALRSVALLPCAAVALVASGPAGAATVTFSGVVLNTCILTLTTPGVLGVDGEGTRLSSEDTGGVAAIMAVVSTGTAPSLNFSAPTLTGPNGWSGTPTVGLKLSSLSGATQAYTSGAFTTRLGQLLDTLTLNARATNSSGFASGSYTIASTVTCQQ